MTNADKGGMGDSKMLSNAERDVWRLKIKKNHK